MEEENSDDVPQSAHMLRRVISDDELVTRSKRELPDCTYSYDLIVQRYRHHVFKLVYYIVHNNEDAEDITQEVFVKVYRHLHDFKQQAKFSRWLDSIARHSALDALDYRQNRLTTLPLVAHNTGTSPHPLTLSVETPEKHILQSELSERIRQVLQQLQRDQVRLLILRDIEGRSYQEIAEILSIGLSATKMRIHRARQSFQKLYSR
jgi:RNA polymerase sigma-70 factor, ECF subfamily